MISFELQTDQKKPSTVARPLDPDCGYAIIVVAIQFLNSFFREAGVPGNF
jgi:hypothetical protein